jgi:hypothetical protein
MMSWQEHVVGYVLEHLHAGDDVEMVVVEGQLDDAGIGALHAVEIFAVLAEPGVVERGDRIPLLGRSQHVRELAGTGANIKQLSAWSESFEHEACSLPVGRSVPAARVFGRFAEFSVVALAHTVGDDARLKVGDLQ